jgi:hypothetical protein
MTSQALYLDRFAWAIVTTTGPMTIGSTLLGISSSAVGPPAVITTSAVHGLSSGNDVLITNAADPLVNGNWTITVLTTTTFSIPVVGSLAGGAGGQVALAPLDSDINTAVASVWSYIAGVKINTV